MKQQIAYLLVTLLISGAMASVVHAGSQGVVNINTADSEELELLPRVGPSLAGRIVAFRDANGPFQKTEELMAVKGIGERSFEQLKPYVSISGETTLDEKVKLPRSKKGNNSDSVKTEG